LAGGADLKVNMDLLKSYLQNESGATAVEYGVMIAVLAIATIVGGKALGDSLNNRFYSVGNVVTDAGIAEGSGYTGG